MNSSLITVKTNKFTTVELLQNLVDEKPSSASAKKTIFIVCKINCSYSRGVLERAVWRRNSGCKLIYCEHAPKELLQRTDVEIVQFGDFENIDWEPVMNGSQRASSYLIRKGLSRKAQLSLQIKRFLSKHPISCLKEAVPYTQIIETWNAFEDMRIDFGGGFSATFDSNNLNLSLREKLELTLEDVKDAMHHSSRTGWSWILKPSVTNKGADSKCS
jgi:hypothetical protein